MNDYDYCVYGMEGDQIGQLEKKEKVGKKKRKEGKKVRKKGKETKKGGRSLWRS